MLATWANWASLYINVVIYGAVSMGFARIEEVETALPLDQFRRLPIPWEAGFLAGKAFVAYRQRGGTRTLPLPDFFRREQRCQETTSLPPIFLRSIPGRLV